MFVRKTVTLIGAMAIIAASTMLSQYAVAENHVAVGNYWAWKFDYQDPSGLRMSGHIVETVASLDNADVMGVPTDVFLVEYSGSGEIFGESSGIPVEGTVTYYGSEVRVASNFSLAGQALVLDLEMTVMELPVNMTLGIFSNFEPPRDDYIGDETITVGNVTNSTSHMTGFAYVDIDGTNDTQYFDNMTWTTMEVMDENVWISTPAGEFYCYEINMTTHMDDGSSESVLYFYSPVVGNYVKWVDSQFGVVSLTSYSYSSGIEPPVANAGPNQTVPIGSEVTLNGSLSTSSGEIVGYRWEFDDEGTHVFFTEEFTYKFNHTGVFNVTLTVADTMSMQDVDYVEITVVDNVPPVANAGGDLYVAEGALVTLNGSLSTDNVGITNYTWSFINEKNGSELFVTYGFEINYTFDTPGDYTVVLTVRDAADNNASDSMKVKVNATGDVSILSGDSLLTALAILGAAIVVGVVITSVLRKRGGKAPSSTQEQAPPQTPPIPPPT